MRLLHDFPSIYIYISLRFTVVINLENGLMDNDYFVIEKKIATNDENKLKNVIDVLSGF